MTRYLEVWGDTVDARHLAGAIGIGIVVPVPIFLVAENFFTANVENPSLGKSYALLVGLIGCVIAGLLAGRFFKPKRIVLTQEAIDPASQQAALDAIVAESGELGDPGELAPPIQKELMALGLYDVLLADHQRREALRVEAANVQPGATSASDPEAAPPSSEPEDVSYAQGHGK